MKVAFIFEDNEKSRLGHILSSVSYNRENIYFAKSNTRVAKKVKQIYDSYDCIVVFFDLVPNNKELYSVIKRTINYLSTKNMLDKLFIIPIICSEYIYFTTISENFGISLPNFSLINTVNYSKSCEKYYKRFLDNAEFGVKEGSYSKYEGDYFCTGYPLFDVVSEEHNKFLNKLGIYTRDVTFNDIILKTVKFYNDFYSLFGLNFNDELQDIKLFKVSKKFKFN